MFNYFRLVKNTLWALSWIFRKVRRLRRLYISYRGYKIARRYLRQCFRAFYWKCYYCIYNNQYELLTAITVIYRSLFISLVIALVVQFIEVTAAKISGQLVPPMISPCLLDMYVNNYGYCYNDMLCDVPILRDTGPLTVSDILDFNVEQKTTPRESYLDFKKIVIIFAVVFGLAACCDLIDQMSEP